MWRMKVSASIQKASPCSPSASHSARKTSRSKRTWSVSVGVKAVKSCVPASTAAHASSAERSSGWGQWSERPCSNGLAVSRVKSR